MLRSRAITLKNKQTQIYKKKKGGGANADQTRVRGEWIRPRETKLEFFVIVIIFIIVAVMMVAVLHQRRDKEAAMSGDVAAPRNAASRP